MPSLGFDALRAEGIKINECKLKLSLEIQFVCFNLLNGKKIWKFSFSISSEKILYFTFN